MISNVISIVLGIISIAYTYFSGKQTLENLTHIKKQYSSFEKKINSDLAYSNKDDENLDAVSDSYIKLLNSSEEDLDEK